MPLDPLSVITQILTLEIPIASKVFHKASRSEAVIKILKKLKLDPTHPPEDFDSIYAYALVEYGIDENGRHKPQPVLELFRLSEIREAFKQAFYSGNKSTLDEAVERVVNLEELDDWDTLGQSIRILNIDLRQELEQFKKLFNQLVEKSQTPADRKLEQKIDELSKKLDTTSQPIISPKSQFNITGFEALIKEKTRSFCGRKFVFEKFDDFTTNNSNGYFTVVGDAGMGKSAIAAKYVHDNHSPCYFNVIAEGRNRPEQFLTSIRQQLINSYDLQDAKDADLSTLLVKTSKKLTKDKPLVIVVDALDEVEQEAGAENILYLPETLPERVYFLLTRRPYTLEKKRLRISAPSQELDLRKIEYQGLNAKDIKGFIRLFIYSDEQHQDALTKWIVDHNINDDTFIEQVAEKSENNFMYLRYVLPAIASGLYDDLSLQQLPSGLQDYYRIHWVRMGMDDKPQELMVKILFILVEIGTAIPCKMISEIVDKDEYDVQSVLNEWVEYLKKQIIEGETCYSIYHASFLDFLKSKRLLDSKRKLFQEVNQGIADYLY